MDKKHNENFWIVFTFECFCSNKIDKTTKGKYEYDGMVQKVQNIT